MYRVFSIKLGAAGQTMTNKPIRFANTCKVLQFVPTSYKVIHLVSTMAMGLLHTRPSLSLYDVATSCKVV